MGEIEMGWGERGREEAELPVLHTKVVCLYYMCVRDREYIIYGYCVCKHPQTYSYRN